MKKTISLCLKAVIFLSAAIGLTLCFAHSNGFMGGVQMLLYFTIQSNIWIAVTAAVGGALMLLGKPTGEWYRVLKYMFTVAIFLTGTVYCFMLAPVISNPWAFSQVLLHVVVPAAAVADFIVWDLKTLKAYSPIKALYVLVPPLYYVIFAGVGYLLCWDFGGGNNYPYFFLNWGSSAGAFGFSSSLPFLGVFYWIVILASVVYGVGFGLVFWARKKHGK